MKKIAVVFVAALISLSFAAIVSATPQKAKQTGKSCDECHGSIPAGPQKPNKK